MPETAILTESSYAKLLTDLRGIIEEGRKKAQLAAGRELLGTYWQLGKRISEEHLTEQAHYGDSILEDLAEDLDIDVDTLRRSVIFFKRYLKKAPRGLNLSWSHYRELVKIPDPQLRALYEKEADQKAWTRDELVRAMERGLLEEGKEKKGRLGQKLQRPTEPTYVYKAVVEEVIDGDTLLLRIDLGFQVWKEQRIRLAQIDAPELVEPKGREAFEYVRNQLAQLDFVMVKTNKIDIYGRYLADLFYSFKEEDKDKIFREGRYLNQELLDRGLATLV